MKKLKSLYDKAGYKVVSIMADDSGSETTEKAGWIAGAVVIVCLLVAAAKAKMPDLFNSILDTAKEKLNGIF